MPGEHQRRAPEGRGDGAAGDADDQLPLLAERFLAELSDQEEGPGGRLRPAAGGAGRSDPAGGPDPASAQGSAAALAPGIVAPDREQVVQLVRAALAATDGLAELVGILESRIDAASADADAVARAVAQSLVATNERLTALERIVLPHGSPDSVAAQQALDRLRLQLSRTMEAGNGSGEPRRGPTPPT